LKFTSSITTYIIFALMALAVPATSFADDAKGSVAIYTGASFPYSDAVSYSSNGSLFNNDVTGTMGTGISAGIKYIIEEKFFYLAPGFEYTHLESDKHQLAIGNALVDELKADIYNFYLDFGLRYEVNKVITPRVFVGADSYINKLTSRPQAVRVDRLTEGAHAGIGTDFIVNRNVSIIFENKWSYSSSANMTVKHSDATGYKWNPGKMTTIIGVKLSY
jgi:hypothetical protein